MWKKTILDLSRLGHSSVFKSSEHQAEENPIALHLMILPSISNLESSSYMSFLNNYSKIPMLKHIYNLSKRNKIKYQDFKLQEGSKHGELMWNFA